MKPWTPPRSTALNLVMGTYFDSDGVTYPITGFCNDNGVPCRPQDATHCIAQLGNVKHVLPIGDR